MLLCGAIMGSRNKFAALEAMRREKAALAKHEMDCWLAERPNGSDLGKLLLLQK